VKPSPNPYPPLISLAVHEFRTPASVVGGYLRMLQGDQEPPMSERQIRMIDQAAKSCERLVAIVAELSEIGKLDGGLLTLALQPLDLFTLIGEVGGLVSEGADRDVRLIVTGPSSGAAIIGDAPRLRIALDAVFRAILRERPGPGVVTAECRRDTRDGRECAILIVADEGRTQEIYDRDPGLFDDGRGGLGLALPLARRVIEGHGGRIWSPAPASPDDGADPVNRGSAIISFPL
jgi:two-component system OmpR family sensor kinase